MLHYLKLKSSGHFTADGGCSRHESNSQRNVKPVCRRSDPRNIIKSSLDAADVIGFTAANNQWSNYDRVREGLAHLKDLAAPAKHLF